TDRPGRRASLERLARNTHDYTHAARPTGQRRPPCAVPHQPRHTHVGAPGAGAHQAPRPGLGPADPGAPAHAAALVCLARAAILGRPARRPGNARPCLDRLDPGIYRARLAAPGPGVRPGASTRQEAATVRTALET